MTHKTPSTIKQFLARQTVRAAALVAVGLVAAAGLHAADAPALINPAAPAAANGKPADPAALSAAAAAAGQTDFAKAASIPASGNLSMWGGTPHRNMVSNEKNPPTEWQVEKREEGEDGKPGKIEQEGKNIKWVAKLGSKAYGNPIISNGLVMVGTNNEAGYDKANAGVDGGVLMAFDEKSGAFKWQHYFAKLAAGRVNDWPGEGLCSTVYAEKDKIWFCSNRCEVVCMDVSGPQPKELWKTDMMKEFGVFPHNMTSAAIASYGDLIYVITGNGVDDTHKNVVAPKAPGIICFDKKTGKAVWSDNSPGDNVLHGQWASVGITEVKRPDGSVQPLVIAPLGDGWVYAYDARYGNVVWKFDSNPKDSIYPQTRNELIATPVIWENKMYIANGQDPEHGTEYAHFWCVDITKTGDISAELPPEGAGPPAKKPEGAELVVPAGQAPNRKGKPNPNSGVVWHFYAEDGNKDGKLQETERFHRSISTAAIDNGLCYVSDFSGYLHCFDANTGKKYWTADLEADVWGSPLVCDGKVYCGDGDGDVHIFATGKEKKEVAVHNMGSPVYGTPVMANGTLYILSMHNLYAIQEKK